MEVLEQITQSTCANKLRVMKSAYVDDRFEKCRTCENYKGNNSCLDFRPYNFTFNVRQGGIIR